MPCHVLYLPCFLFGAVALSQIMFSAGSTTGNVSWLVWQARSLQPTCSHVHALMRVQAVSSCIHLVDSPRSSSLPNASWSKAPSPDCRSWGPVLHIPGLQRVVKSRDGATERPDLGLVVFPGEALLLNPLLLLFHHVCASTEKSILEGSPKKINYLPIIYTPGKYHYYLTMAACVLSLILLLECSCIGLIYSSVNQKDVGRITDLIAQWFCHALGMQGTKTSLWPKKALLLTDRRHCWPFTFYP